MKISSITDVPKKPAYLEQTIKDDAAKGFSFETNDSLGMEIIGALIEQIDASIVAENKSGACFTISFKNK